MLGVKWLFLKEFVMDKNSIKPIGGYFGLEDTGDGFFPHQNGILLNTARNALEYILLSIHDIKSIYLPYYTCEVVLEPIQKLGIHYISYHVDERLEIQDNIELEEGQYIIVNNYFGIKDAYIKKLVKKYGDKIIVDCAQAFFAPVLPHTKMFYSMRKFVGVPDGGVAYGVNEGYAKGLPFDDSSDRMTHLILRKKEGAEVGFIEYQKNERKLDGQHLKLMSAYTRNSLNNINYQGIIEKRNKNYEFLDKHLRNSNGLKRMLDTLDYADFVCPMVYPYYSNDVSLKSRLITNKVFVATYWPNVLEKCKPSTIDYALALHIIPLPIDQRYDEEDMEYICNLIKK